METETGIGDKLPQAPARRNHFDNNEPLSPGGGPVAKPAAKSRASAALHTRSSNRETETVRKTATDLPAELAVLDGEADLVFRMLEHRIHDMFSY
jgi:hypothetical protein